MKVFRVEKKDTGTGPYAGNAPMDRFDYFGSRHPAPDQDGINPLWLGYGSPFYFGFANLRQMFQWFHWTDIFRWRKHGFRVIVYTVADDRVMLGGRQLAFVKAQAKSRHEVRMAQLAKHLIRLPLVSS